MRGHVISLGAAVCLLLHLAAVTISHADMQNIVWKEVRNGIRDFDLRRVAASPDDPDTVYVSSLTSVYRTSDRGKTWNEVLSLRGTGNTINALATGSKTDTVLTGTLEGLYRSDDRGMHWRKIFRGVGEREGSVISIVVHPQNSEMIFIGTGSGVYRTENNGQDWNRGLNMPSRVSVASLSIDSTGSNTLYAATGKGLYKSINYGIDWQRVFGMTDAEENGNATDEQEDEETEGIKTGVEIRSVVTDLTDDNRVYLGTSSGLLISEDGGYTWKGAGESGLLSRDIRHLVISLKDRDSIFAATEKGVFRYSRASDSWEELYNGLVTDDVRFLVFSQDARSDPDTLWAATGNGIFKTVPMRQSYLGLKDADVQEVLTRFNQEPTIQEIRAAAIEYAEVQPEKIEKWRNAAARKALLPDLTFHYDKDKSWNSSAYFYSGKYVDDDITRDHGRGWSVSLTWKLGELIWNDDQTSIDSRSKLMVELRDDVLNEVTRLYFERRKMQIETLLLPQEDIREKLDRDLRIQELTADIDSLTGSYLSKRLAQTKEEQK
jgi:photosystem II stability/assembly factor-like uncharacterized protein